MLSHLQGVHEIRTSQLGQPIPATALRLQQIRLSHHRKVRNLQLHALAPTEVRVLTHDYAADQPPDDFRLFCSEPWTPARMALFGPLPASPIKTHITGAMQENDIKIALVLSFHSISVTRNFGGVSSTPTPATGSSSPYSTAKTALNFNAEEITPRKLEVSRSIWAGTQVQYSLSKVAKQLGRSPIHR